MRKKRMKSVACLKPKLVKTWKVMAVLPATRPASTSPYETRPRSTDR